MSRRRRNLTGVAAQAASSPSAANESRGQNNHTHSLAGGRHRGEMPARVRRPLSAYRLVSAVGQRVSALILKGDGGPS